MKNKSRQIALKIRTGLLWKVMEMPSLLTVLQSHWLSKPPPFQEPLFLCFHSYPSWDRQWSIGRRLSPLPRALHIFLKQYNLNVQALKINWAKPICHLAPWVRRKPLDYHLWKPTIQHKGHCCPGGLQPRLNKQLEIKYTIRQSC